MRVGMEPGIAPMLAKLARALPDGEGYTFEPKWDGFRALAFRNDDDVDLRSRNQRPLARYFPEITAGVLQCSHNRFVLDGELVVFAGDGTDFEALMLRLHPSASRVELLARTTPATYMVFDLLAIDDRDLRDAPFAERRSLLEELLRDAPARVQLTPTTSDRRVAEQWMHGSLHQGVDGVVAKHRDLRYEPGRRVMLKIKPERTADCVVAGYRWYADNPREVGSLLLGLYEDTGALVHVGVVTSFPRAQRRVLVAELASLEVPIAGHPWEHGFGLGASPLGRLKGAAGRWDPATMPRDWTPLAPALVAEVAFDSFEGLRFRHPARFRRWRPDRDAHSCTFAQLDAAA